MPLKFLRVRVTRCNPGDAVQVALSASSLAKELATMSLFPPAAAAVTILMLILETVQSLAENKEACGRLARRCANILLDINDQMNGRWDTAPPPLVRNLERFAIVLQSIRDFMQHLSDLNWRKRLLRKVSIENALAEHHAQLDDATHSFQIATLINIHYAVAAQPSRNIDNTTTPTSSKVVEVEEPNIEPPRYTPSVSVGILKDQGHMGALIAEPVEASIGNFAQEQPSTTMEDYGFRRYHQSEIRLRSTAMLRDGWWMGASIVEVDGQHALIKKYEGPKQTAARKWLQDIHVLQNVFHPNFPQLIGFSSEDTPTPFILLSNAHTRSPQNLLSFIIKEKGVAETLEMLLKFHYDITEAIIYATRQLNLTETKSQDFIEGAFLRVDASNTIIISPPPPQDGNCVSFRNYTLTESLTSTTLNLLPQKTITHYWRSGSDEEQRKFASLNHIISLANSFLPSNNEPLHLPPAIQELFSFQSSFQLSPDLDLQQIHKPKITLRHLRLLCLMNRGHNHIWSENQAIPTDHFMVGDFGYMLNSSVKDQSGNLNDKMDKDFVKNFIKLEGFQLLDGLYCWPVAVPPQQQINCQIFHSKKFKENANGWKYLLENGRNIADKAQIKPEDIMLITLAGKSQDFYIKDFSPVFFQPIQPPSFTRNNLTHYLPSILYLTTSFKKDFLPYWSHSLGLKVALQRQWVSNLGWSHGYINWVQLHKEDFI